MTAKRKPRSRRATPPLCLAVRRTRQALHLTQDAFAQQIGTAVMTLSKWERGVHQPTDPAALLRLRQAAASAGLAAEQKLFDESLPPFPEGIVDQSIDHRILGAVGYGSALVMHLGSISEWHEMFAHRLANAYLPEVANAMRDAAAPALELLKAIIAEEAPEDSKLDIAFFNRLALRLDVLAAQKVFAHKFKEGK
jgi:transcriptional regulator with XRE-family HTH domain